MANQPLDTLTLSNAEVPLSGIFDPTWQPVYDAFAENFRSRRELGAAVSPQTIDLMTQSQWRSPCAVWGTPMNTALGLLINDPEFFYIDPNPNAFGTAGAGGSFGMADRENRLSMSYSVNRWWPALAPGDRERSLIDAAYRGL